LFKSIRAKLLILMIAANVLMVIGMMALNALQFNRSFSDYIIQQETLRLQPLITSIARQYDLAQNWDWLRWNNPEWLQMLRQSFSPRDMMRHGVNHPPGGPRNFIDNLNIKDASTGRVLLGQHANADDRKRVWLPVQNTDGTTVAYLGFEPSSRANQEFDQLFQQEQQRGLVIIGVFGILIAAALAVPFSGWLVRPITKLTSAVRQMASGNLSVSVNEKRQDELGRLAKDFNRLATILAKNQYDRQQWVSDIAHELRTPVALFLADIEAVQDGVRAVNEQWLANMHDQVERLSRLVNDLHQLSQSDAGTLNYRFEPLNLNALLESVLAHFGQSETGHFQISADLPRHSIWIRGDDTRLNQLFNNLIQNTLRYTDSDINKPGRLQVSLTTEKNHAVVVWQDSAPGVGDHDLDKLFERLYRVDESRSRDSGGAGLGLAIVQNIVAAHEGGIHAKHSDLGGVKLVIRFPLEVGKDNR
jgi:two-component system, OmpR family, sensor histidine kinase BaeS